MEFVLPLCEEDRAATGRDDVYAWIAEHGHERRGGGWAIYWTDPGIEPDPEKWRTQILVPIRGEEPQER